MKYIYRNGASNGLWCSLLLPVSILSLDMKFEISMYKLLSFILLWIPVLRYLNCASDIKLPTKISRYILLAIFVCFIVAWILLSYSITTLLICFIVVSSCNYVNNLLLKSCPGSFTLGESIIIIQGILLFLSEFLDFFNTSQSLSVETDYQKSLKLLKLLLLGCLLLVYTLYIIPVLKYGILFHLICFSFAGAMMLIWSMMYQNNVIPWFLGYCVQHQQRVFLFLFWIFLSVAAILFVIWTNHKTGYTVSTLDRKYFHLIIDVVYISGIFYDIQFLNIASGFALGAFIVLELYRLVQVPIIGSAIEKAFEVFLDEKDSGVLILTHIYLLIGCSSPIWLSSYYVHKREYHISLLSGILSVGIGDTFAAIGGILLGKNRWKGSKKTLEGTICAFIAQLLASTIFLSLGHSLSVFNIILVILATFFSSLLEAKTTQVDNLVLPLCTFAILFWVH